MILLMLLYGTKSRENNRPNGQPAKCITPSEFYKKQVHGYEGIGQWLIGFCVYVSVVVRRFATGDAFLFICSKLHFEFLQASSD